MLEKYLHFWLSLYPHDKIMIAQYKRIVIKIGSNVLTRKDGSLDIARMADLVHQVAELRNRGIEVILISSGAVAAGRNEIVTQKKLDPVSSRQLYASLGQAKLITLYFDFFREHHMACGQVLTMKESFSSRTHYLNQKNCIDVMLANQVIPIINENDAVSVTELMFTDNDELSGLISTMMDADLLIILSNIDGIFNGDPSLPDSKVIKVVEQGMDLSTYIQPGKSSFGRGGMETKCNIARKVADEGTTVLIANGMKANILNNLLTDPRVVDCTCFLPSKKATNSVKRWIAHSDGFAKGEIYINIGAEKALQQAKATSVLFIGIIKITGDFQKDDIVLIKDEEGKQIGVGKAGYDSEKAETLIGKRNAKPMIHYDFMYLE